MTVPSLAFSQEAGAVPALGFGTSPLTGGLSSATVIAALKAGYRHIDTARKYGTEPAVGEAMRASGVPRQDIFLTTKVSHENLRAADFARSVDESLAALKVDYVDLLLVHWPNPAIALAETMPALAKAKRQGLARHIGVANFNIGLLDQAVELCPEPLVALQAEYHPFLDQTKLLAAVRRHRLVFIAYCPLARGRLFGDPVLADIAGKLSSTGKYSGVLQSLEVQGVTDVPGFSLDPVGRAVPLHTEFYATVYGTNGDTYLHPVRATLIHSEITANGSVVRVPEKQGHLITLDVVSPKARLEDLLQLSTKSNQPMMTGMVNLKTKLILPPGKVKVLDKLVLDGEFTVSDGRFASSDVRDKLAAFSRHAEGQPDNPDAGSAISDLHGKFHLKNGVIMFEKLTFSVPGAVIRLDGTYKMRGEELDFNGDLRTDAKISEMVGGKKSFFLKAIDPFFSKEGAGTLIPIGITGTRDNPTLEISMFHKKIRKSFGGSDKDDATNNKNGGKKTEPVKNPSPR